MFKVNKYIDTLIGTCYYLVKYLLMRGYMRNSKHNSVNQNNISDIIADIGFEFEQGIDEEIKALAIRKTEEYCFDFIKTVDTDPGFLKCIANAFFDGYIESTRTSH